tara:strand:+ start:1732 stop:2091 length:360 start_codon:yes stop_codon:yes gene_type:complete
VYYRAREIALNNNHTYHIAAFAKRGNGFVFGKNSDRCSAKFERIHPDGSFGYHLHAEMDLINKFKVGTISEIHVVRFRKNGEMTMARPCKYCQRFLKRHGVRKVNYTDWNGNWTCMKIR